MPLIGVLNTMVDGTFVTAGPHNSNYDAIRTAFNASAVLTDVVKTITVSHNWNAVQNFAGGITGSLTGNVTGNLTGTVLTPAQANITSLGTLTSLTVSGLITASGGITVSGGLTVATGGLTVTAGGVTVTAGGIVMAAGNTIAINGLNVLGPRAAGWATQTGAQTRADMGGAPTLATVASTLDALIMDLRGHGMI